MKYLSLFSGIGAFEKALKNIDVDIELVGFSEIDKYAIKSYCAVHGIDESLNLGDINKINLDDIKKLGEIDLITHGSPCQDFSVAGLQAGGDEGSGTRSSLMWRTVDIVQVAKPKYVIWENVKNLLSKKHRHNFDSYLEVMGGLGYKNFYKVLNAKDYGIPQNRERVYTISIRCDLIDDGLVKEYKFPKEIDLKKKLKDVLESDVDEKYYLDDKLIIKLLKSSKKPKMDDIKVIGEIDIKGHDCIKRVYDTDGLAPTLTDMQGGNRQPKVAVAMRGRYNNLGKTEQKIEISSREIANSITTVQKDSMVREGIRVRKLTPKECWRLMGFDDKDFNKAKEVGISNTQLYKQAGNSIVINVLEAIFKNLFLFSEYN